MFIINILTNKTKVAYHMLYRIHINKHTKRLYCCGKYPYGEI